MNYSRLLKVCKESKIPIPASYYWTQKEFGKPVVQIALPESDIAEIEVEFSNSILKRGPIKKVNKDDEIIIDKEDNKDEANTALSNSSYELDKNILPFLTNEERDNFYSVINQLSSTKEFEYHKVIKKIKIPVKKIQQNNSNYNETNTIERIFKSVSNDSQKRVFDILNRILVFIEKSGDC